MKRTVILVAAGVAVAAGIAIVALTRPSPDGGAAGAARTACDRARAFIRLVERNAAATDVREELARATTAATRAASLDPTWTALRSGLETFGVALDHDDAGSANVAMRVVQAQCATAGGAP